MASNEYTPTYEQFEQDGNRLTAIDGESFRTHLDKSDWADWHEDQTEGEWESIVGVLMGEIAHDGDAIPRDPSSMSSTEIKIAVDEMVEMLAESDLDEHLVDDEEMRTRQAQALVDYLIHEGIFETDGSEVLVLKDWNNSDLSREDYMSWAATFDEFVDMIDQFQDTIENRIENLEKKAEEFENNGLEQSPDSEIADMRDSLYELFDGKAPPAPKDWSIDAQGGGFVTVEPPENVPDSKVEDYKMYYSRMIEVDQVIAPDIETLGPQEIRSLEDQLRIRLRRLEDLGNKFEQAVDRFRWAAINAESHEDEQRVKQCMESMMQLFVAVTDFSQQAASKSADDLHDDYFPEAEDEARQEDLEQMREAEDEVVDRTEELEQIAEEGSGTDPDFTFDDSPNV